jgi:hypothetical protein
MTPDKPPDERSGPRWLGALVPRIARPAFKRRSPAAAALMADWPAVIGPALAAVTQPVKLTRAKDAPGTLTIRCAGPIALELQHLAPQVIARINTHAGFALVGGLKFERGSIAPPVAPKRLPPAPPPDSAGLEAIADATLRDALARLRATMKDRP